MATSQSNLVLKIKGMDCAEEVAILKREIGSLVGGEANLSFDVLKGQMTVLASAPDANLESIVKTRPGCHVDPNPVSKLYDTSTGSDALTIWACITPTDGFTLTVWVRDLSSTLG